jgi:hypothetical protein
MCSCVLLRENPAFFLIFGVGFRSQALVSSPPFIAYQTLDIPSLSVLASFRSSRNCDGVTDASVAGVAGALAATQYL